MSFSIEARPLREGERLEIGDEYQRDGTWVRLTAEDLEEWASSVSHYWPSRSMYPFRRPSNKPTVDIERTEEIFDRLNRELADSAVDSWGGKR